MRKSDIESGRLFHGAPGIVESWLELTKLPEEKATRIMKKRRKKKFNRATEARRAARNSGVAPASTRVIEDKRKRPPKHKQNWLETDKA